MTKDKKTITAMHDPSGSIIREGNSYSRASEDLDEQIKETLSTMHPVNTGTGSDLKGSGGAAEATVINLEETEGKVAEEPKHQQKQKALTKNAGQVCEKCNEKNVKCLCHVEFMFESIPGVCSVVDTKDTGQDNIYQWRGGNGALSGDGATVVSVIMKDGSINMDYKILYSNCRNPNFICHKDCTTLYYYELDNKKNKLGDITHKMEQESNINFKFNEAYLEKGEKAKIPHYLETKKNEEGDYIWYLSQDGALLINEDISKLNEKGTITWSFLGAEKLPKDANALLDFFKRSIGFALNSELYHIPTSLYHVAVMECKYSPQMKIDLKDPLTLKPFDQAKATVYVIPQYEVEHDIALSFGTMNINAVTQGGNRLKRLLDFLLKELQFTVTLKEKFNGQDGNTITIVIKDLDNLSNLKSNPAEVLKKIFIEGSPLYLFAKLFAELLTFLINFSAYVSIYKDMTRQYNIELENFRDSPDKMENKLPDEDVLTFNNLELPDIHWTGTSQLIIKDNKPQVERINNELEFKPVLGGGCTINLAIWLIKKIPLLEATYQLANSFCTFINAADFGAYLSVSTTKLTSEQKKKYNEAFFGASLVIYGNISFSYTANTSWTIATSALYESPKKKVKNLVSNVGIEFSAGAYFQAKIWIFSGALAVNMTVKTGFVFGEKTIFRKDTKAEEDIVFSYFKGVDILWSIEGSLGVSLNNEEDNKNDDLGDWSAKAKGDFADKPIEGLNYYDEPSAIERKAELDRLKPQWEQAERDAEKALEARVGVMGKDAYYANGGERPSAVADRKVPGYSKKEHDLLNGGALTDSHIKIYRDNAKDLNRMAEINQQLKTEKDPYERYSLLNQRFLIMDRTAKMLFDKDVPLKPDSYLLADLTKEYELRDEFSKILDKSEGVDKDYIEQRKKALNNLEDGTGRSRFSEGHLFGLSHLDPSEFKKLEDEIKKEYA